LEKRLATGIGYPFNTGNFQDEPEQLRHWDYLDRYPRLELGIDAAGATALAALKPDDKALPRTIGWTARQDRAYIQT